MELLSYYAATMFMVSVCVVGWLVLCVCDVHCFAFGGLWWGGKSVGVRGGSVISDATYQERDTW